MEERHLDGSPSQLPRALAPIPLALTYAHGLVETGPSAAAGQPRRNSRNAVIAACQACRRRKTKCDANNPCLACTTRGAECVYDTQLNETHSQALKRKFSELQSKTSAYKNVYDLLRDQPEDDANLILKRIRAGVDIDDLLEDPTLVLQSIRSEIGLPIDNFPEHKTGLGVLPPIYSEKEFELLVRHPNAYLTLDPSDDTALSMSPFLRPSTLVKQSRTNDKSLTSENLSQVPKSTATTPVASRAGNIRHPYVISPHLSSGPVHIDPRLKRLNIEFWTSVPITNEHARNVISLYLETNYPILGLFDVDLFLDDLVHCRLDHCSPFLVTALLAFATQSYTTKEPISFSRSYEFEREAERLWEVEANSDNPTTLAGLVLLFESIGTHGRMAMNYMKSLSEMAARMKLFGVEDRLSIDDFNTLSRAEQLSTAYAAWGAFNFMTNGENKNMEQNTAKNRTAARELMTGTFPYFCDFWTTVSEVMFIYRSSRGRGRVSLAFALSKFYKLLSLADNMSSSMVRGQRSPSHVLVFHIWYHAVVLDIFRPFILDEKQHGFQKWTALAAPPDAIFAASVKQLKRLILAYGAQHKAASYSVFWHAGLMYVANAVLKDLGVNDWEFYFLLCIRSYSKLSASFQFAGGLAQGLLGMALISGAISNKTALMLKEELRDDAKRCKFPDGTVQGFTLDLNLAHTDGKAARVEELVEKFNEITVFDGSTTGV